MQVEGQGEYATSNRGRGGQGSPLPPRAFTIAWMLEHNMRRQILSTLSFLPLILNNKKVEKSISFSGLYFCRRNQVNVNHLSYKFTGGTAILPRNSEFQEQVGIKLLTC